MKLPSRLRWLWLTLGIVVLDRATKAWFETQTNEGWRHEVVRHLIYLVHSRNPGIAFSLFADSHSPWLHILLIGGSLAVICALAWLLVAGQGSARLPRDSRCCSEAPPETSPTALFTARSRTFWKCGLEATGGRRSTSPIPRSPSARSF